MKVMKFGGTCLGSEDALDRVSKVVQAEKDSKIVVVSAASGVTNTLKEFISKPRQEKEIDDLLLALRMRHIDMLPKTEGQVRKEALDLIEEKMTKLERLLYGVTYTEELTPRTNDLILSFGERLSVIVVAARLTDEGLNAIAMESDAIGFITNDHHGNAVALLDLCEKNMGASLDSAIRQGITPVVTGFFGTTQNGHVTTVGRSGTDYSAAVIAYATNAKPVEIWKEVDGFMSADPKLVKESFTIESLSYEEAAELAYFGAQVLHARAVQPARLKGIEIIIKNLYSPEAPGTTIGNGKQTKKDVIKSVSYVPKVATLKVYDTGAGYKSGFLSDITNCLASEGVNIFSATTSQTCVAVLIDENQIHLAKRAIKSIIGGVGESFEIKPGVALVCTVGEGLGYTEGVAARVFKAVASKKVNVDLISAGASTVAYHFTVDNKDLKKTVMAIHKEFFTPVQNDAD
ncbi:MAG: aspartate kinase [Candidatus Thermoplasmatota archaeon]|nr:aspartate kinase [Candidatus Thermoplasmatota archaeon]